VLMRSGPLCSPSGTSILQPSANALLCGRILTLRPSTERVRESSPLTHKRSASAYGTASPQVDNTRQSRFSLAFLLSTSAVVGHNCS
jgi:hypothetical protein